MSTSAHRLAMAAGRLETALDRLRFCVPGLAPEIDEVRRAARGVRVESYRAGWLASAEMLGVDRVTAMTDLELARDVKQAIAERTVTLHG